MSKRQGNYVLMGLLVVVALIAIIPDVAYAAPGGMIAKAVAKTWIGKIAIFSIIIILFPFIVYNRIKEKIAVRKTKKDLKMLVKLNDTFRWTALNEHAHTVITQVYSAWKKADVEKARDWMTDWYWQNQQMTVMDDWESRGLKNHCTLKKVNYVRPLHVEYSERQPGDGEGSRIMLAVGVNLQDYLMEEETKIIVEGDTEYKNVGSMWTLLLEGGRWKLSLIEQNDLRFTYAKMANDIEEAKEHLKSGFKYRKSIQN